MLKSMVYTDEIYHFNHANFCLYGFQINPLSGFASR
jgi:hypothetical protein